MEWNLKDIFENEEKFKDCKNALDDVLVEIEKYQGKLGESSEMLCACYGMYEKALELCGKIYAYGMLKYHLDMANQDSIRLFKEVESLEAKFSQVVSFMVPEITEMDEKVLRKFMAENSNLSRYKRTLEKILEKKKHVLGKAEEGFLSQFSEVFANSENTFDILINTEFKFGEILDENGNKIEMTDGTYTKFLHSKKEEIRRQAFDLMYDQYSQFKNTITELYLARVKQYTIMSKLRKYQSSLENAVLHDDASILVYENLIESVHKNLAINHAFMKLKKKMLKTEKMHLYDIYQNPIEEKEEKVSFEFAKKEVLTALKILGEEYSNKLEEAFENHWLDVYEKPNKRGGAYSMGIYGNHPFALLNFVETKRDISTIAHELGHSMHSYYSNQSQNILDSNYTIMVAEVASTVNEILLASYQIEEEKDKRKKAELIYELLEMIRSTLFRQAMFAEFEKMVHEKVEKNEMLSSQDLCEIYYDLNQMYFGSEVVIDDKIKYEWMRIPHFYSCFYVYKYATGISSAIAIASKILNHEPGFTEKYIEMLKQGCSKKSIDLLKMVDVDLESSKPYEEAIQFYQDKIKELESLI